MTDDREDAALKQLLEKLSSGQIKAGEAYVFDADEVVLIKEMMEAWVSGKAFIRVGRMLGRTLIWAGAVYGAYIAVKNGVLR